MQKFAATFVGAPVRPNMLNVPKSAADDDYMSTTTTTTTNDNNDLT